MTQRTPAQIRLEAAYHESGHGAIAFIVDRRVNLVPCPEHGGEDLRYPQRIAILAGGVSWAVV